MQDMNKVRETPWDTKVGFHIQREGRVVSKMIEEDRLNLNLKLHIPSV